jgi:tRNA nucleotidyltransferase (CCA-adding enzyme)
LAVASKVSAERVFVELTKLLTGIDAPAGLMALAKYGLLGECLPEMSPSMGCEQNDYHAFDVWGHTLETVRHAPNDPAMRWAALLHDVGKPSAKTIGPDGRTRFHGHEALSEELARQALSRLKASNALQAETLALIRHHGAWPDQTWSSAAYRRLLHRLAKDGLDWRAWAALQLADQMGKGLDTENVFKNHAELLHRMEGIAVQAPPLNVRALAIDGNAMMKLANMPPGPWVGALQKHLLEAVMDDPKLNNVNDLEKLAKEWLKKGQK